MSNFIKQFNPAGSAGISTKYPEINQSGPFSPICSASLSTININQNSNIFIGMNLSNTLNITNKDIAISINENSTWRVWLEIFFGNGTPLTSNFNYNTSWWQNYPEMQEFNGSIKNLTNQIALRIPVLTIDPFALSPEDADGFIFEFGDFLFKIKRHIYNDLILFQSCDGFMLLPSPVSKPY